MARKSNVNQQDVLFAENLRRRGVTYKDIVVQMDGKVTLDWCKRMLKHIKEDSPESRAKESILKLALRSQGVTYAECCEVLVDNSVCSVVEHEENGDETMYTTYKRIKDSLKNKYKEEVLFRPMWMRPDAAFDSIKVLNGLADCLNARFEEAVDSYMEDIFPDDYGNTAIRKSLSHELAMIAIPFKSSEGVLHRCDRNAKMAETLDERVTIHSLGANR